MLRFLFCGPAGVLGLDFVKDNIYLLHSENCLTIGGRDKIISPSEVLLTVLESAETNLRTFLPDFYMNSFLC